MLPKILIANLFLNAASASPFGPYPGQPHGPDGRALYIQDNDPAGNNIIAAEISPSDGKLSNAVKIPTGGKGLDTLIAASQDSVTVSGNYVFATNAGDDTLSLFRIDPNHPTNLQLLGKPANTRGNTPVSVAYSEKLNVACAANAGNIAGIACFEVDQRYGLKPLPFFLDIPNTGAPVSAVGVLVQAPEVRFNPSSTAIFATVDGPSTSPGLLYSWPIHHGRFSTTAVKSTFEGIIIPFSLNFLGSDSKVFMTNPHLNSPGAALLDIAPSGQVTHVQNITIPNQVASCWAAYDPAISRLFVMDAARPVITILDSNSGRVTSQYNFTASFGGAQDTKIDGNFLYVLTDPVQSDLELAAPPQVLVYDVSPVSRGATPQEVQSFDILQVVGKLPGAIGLAVYPAAQFT